MVFPRQLTGIVFGIFSTVCLAGMATQAAADRGDPDPAAEAYLSNLADETLGMFSDAEMPRADKRTRFRELLVNNVDFLRFGCSALGTYCPQIRRNSPDAFEDYLTVLKDYADFLLFAQFENYADHTFEIKSSSLRPRSSTTYVEVVGDLKDERGTNVGGANWILIKSGDEANPSYKILDIVIRAQDEGGTFSLLVTQRDEFTSILVRNNREIQALINFLKERVEDLQEEEQTSQAAVAAEREAALENALPYPFYMPEFETGEFPVQRTAPNRQWR